MDANLSSIIVVDADASLRQDAVRELGRLGYDVAGFDRAAAALSAMRARRPDLALVDWALPDAAGIDVLSEVKASDDLKAVRVLVTSGRGDPDDIVAAFRHGADDFLARPCTMQEFVARVGATLRRPAGAPSSGRIDAGGITVDDVGHRVSVDGQCLALAPREYRLLHFLLSNPDRVFSRRQLLMNVWDRDGHVGPRTVDVHIRRLRSLLEPHGRDGYLQTVRGSGYRFSLDN